MGYVGISKGRIRKGKYTKLFQTAKSRKIYLMEEVEKEGYAEEAWAVSKEQKKMAEL